MMDCADDRQPAFRTNPADGSSAAPGITRYVEVWMGRGENGKGNIPSVTTTHPSLHAPYAIRTVFAWECNPSTMIP